MHTTTTHQRRTVAVIPCGTEKADGPCEARDLYTSSGFRLALDAALNIAHHRDVFVLSALHGLVPLDTVLAPYELRMGQPGCVTAETVAAQAEAHGIAWGDDVYALLPRDYFRTLDAALRTLDVYAADVYEVNAGIGDQRHICKVVAA